MDDTRNAFTSDAAVATEQPSRYLQQLCKHFQHRLPETTFNETSGRVVFDVGTCNLTADAAGTLAMRVHAGTTEDLATLEDLVGSHLERFDFRAALSVSWTRAE